MAGARPPGPQAVSRELARKWNSWTWSGTHWDAAGAGGFIQLVTMPNTSLPWHLLVSHCLLPLSQSHLFHKSKFILILALTLNSWHKKSALKWQRNHLQCLVVLFQGTRSVRSLESLISSVCWVIWKMNLCGTKARAFQSWGHFDCVLFLSKFSYFQEVDLKMSWLSLSYLLGFSHNF